MILQQPVGNRPIVISLPQSPCRSQSGSPSPSSSLQRVTQQQIHTALEQQRLENDKLLTKLISDQKKFVRICKHYEKKLFRVQREATEVKHAQNADKMQSLLEKHRKATEVTQRAIVDGKAVKDAVWKEVTFNMELVNVVYTLNKNIDCYHILIAKKNEELTAIVQHEYKTSTGDLITVSPDDDVKDSEEETVDTVATPPPPPPPPPPLSKKHRDRDRPPSDEKEESPPPTASVDAPSASAAPTASEDPVAIFAQQLIDKNTRYQEIVAVMRQRVDDLRKFRKDDI